MEHLYELLRNTLDEDVGAMKLLVGRFVGTEVKGAEFVEGVRCANEELMKMARKSSRLEVLEAYAGFVEEWCERGNDTSLVRSSRVRDEASCDLCYFQKEYLALSLRSVVKEKGKEGRRSGRVLAAAVRVMLRVEKEDPTWGAKAVHMARKYTKQEPRSAAVWLARLESEKKMGMAWEETWGEARRWVDEAWTDNWGIHH